MFEARASIKERTEHRHSVSRRAAMKTWLRLHPYYIDFDTRRQSDGRGSSLLEATLCIHIKRWSQYHARDRECSEGDSYRH